MKFILAFIVLITLLIQGCAVERGASEEELAAESETEPKSNEESEKSVEEVVPSPNEGIRPALTLEDALSRAEEIQRARDQRTGEVTRHTEITYDELMDESNWPPYRQLRGRSEHLRPRCGPGERAETHRTSAEVNPNSALRRNVHHQYTICVRDEK